MSCRISIELVLDEIEKDIEKGKYVSVRQEISELKRTDISDSNKINLDLYLCRVLRETGELIESSELSLEILDKAYMLKDENLIIQALLEKAYCDWYTNDLEGGKKLTLAAQEIMKKSEHEYNKFYARSNIILGNLVGDQGNLDLSLEYYTYALKIYRSINDKDGMAYSLNNLGTYHHLFGNLDEALICYQKSGDLFKELDNSINISISLGNIGTIYLNKGDMDKALDHFLKSNEILEIIKDKMYQPGIKTNIGMFYYAKGDYEAAKKYFGESLVLLEDLGNSLWVSETLLYYILTLSEIDLSESRKLLDKFEKIIMNDTSKSKLIDVRYKLAKSMVLKKTNRLENLVISQNILYEIVNSDEILDYRVTLMSMNLLADLLILELKLNDDADLLAELINLISKLNDNAMIHGSYNTQIQTYILFAKLKLLSGNYEVSLEALETADKIAKENGLKQLEKEISQERDKILSEASMYERVYDNLTGINDKLQQADIESYLNEIVRNGILQFKPDGGSGSTS